MNTETKTKTLKQKYKELEAKYADAIEVLKQIEKLPMESFHLENFKRKYPQEFR